MENLAGFWSAAPLWGSLIVLIVIAIVFRRVVRPKAPTPEQVLDRSWSGTDADNLDSSHIGGPIFVNPSEQGTRHDAAMPPRGEPASGTK